MARIIHDSRPGSYDRIMTWLDAHSPATVNEVCEALGVTRSRALLVLRAAQANGEARGTLTYEQGRSPRWPLQWSARQPAVICAGPDCWLLDAGGTS